MTSEQQAPSTADIAYGTSEQQPDDDGGMHDTAEDIRDDGMASARGTHDAGEDVEAAPLLSAKRSDDLNTQWATIQGEFVDAPREAVEQADHLVAEVIQDLARTFADERAALEEQWGREEDVDTEALRLALQRYRSFFHRLLAA
jgi:hypothetical protein